MTFTYSRRYRGPVQMVVLDWAGTTLDYGSIAPVVAFREVFRRQGVEISIEEARGPMGAHKLVHIREISRNPPVARRWQDVHGKPCTEDDVQEMYTQFVPVQLDCLAQYADLVPGTLESVAHWRQQGIRIGSSTGYTDAMMKVVTAEAARRGFHADAVVCANEVPAGRPEPWMCLENARRLRIYPMEACVKIGDTVPDIDEGLNAGMWTIGLTKTGNELGLSEAEAASLPADDLQARLDRANQRFAQAGAHYVVESLADARPIIDQINCRLARGEQP